MYLFSCLRNTKALLRQCFFISIITEDFALKRTTNYALPDWEKSDFIQMSERPDAQARHRAQKPRRHTGRQGRHLGRHRRAAGGRGGARGQLPRQARGPARDDDGKRHAQFRPLAGRHDEDRGDVLYILRGLIERQYGNFGQRYITGDGVQQQLEHDGGDFMAGANVRRCFFRVNAGAEQQQRDRRLRRLRRGQVGRGQQGDACRYIQRGSNGDIVCSEKVKKTEKTLGLSPEGFFISSTFCVEAN